MWTKLMDRITGSSLPRHDKVSLIDAQNEEESSPLLEIIGDGSTGAEAGDDPLTGAGAGGDGRWAVSGTCEGTVVTDGNAGCKTATGAMVATMADILSSFLSKSRILLGGWPSILGFAGLLRATCSMHSTRAFWHLTHVLCRGRGKVAEKTYLWHTEAVSEGTQRTLCLRPVEIRKSACRFAGPLQRSHANALPDLPSLASMAMAEL